MEVSELVQILIVATLITLNVITVVTVKVQGAAYAKMTLGMEKLISKAYDIENKVGAHTDMDNAQHSSLSKSVDNNSAKIDDMIRILGEIKGMLAHKPRT